MNGNWWIRAWTLLRVLISLFALWLTADWFNREVLQPALVSQTYGFGAYYSAARLLAKDQISAEIYAPDYFSPIVLRDSNQQISDIYNANPPTTSMMLWPLASLDSERARRTWTWLNVAFLVGGITVLMWGFEVPIRDFSKWPVWCLVIAFGLLFQPAVQNFMFGQAYLLLFLLLAIITTAFFKNRPAGGIALASALLLKTAGWPLLILLAWLRKGRFLAWTVGSATVILIGSLLVFPVNMWSAYGRLLLQVGRSPLICVPAYQTTRSWLCHLFAPDVRWQTAEMAGIGIPVPATAAYIFLGLFCLGLVLALAREHPQPAFIATISWSVLFLPLGEIHHHTLLLIPFIWVIVRGDELRGLSQLMIMMAAYFYLLEFKVNQPAIQSGPGALLAYPYLAGAWLLFIAILWDQKPTLLLSFRKKVSENRFCFPSLQDRMQE